MKRALLVIIIISLLEPNHLISQDKSIDQKLTLTGYGLLKVSNELNFIKTELAEVREKLFNLDQLDGLELCNISRLIENISLVEAICRYEGIILGIFHNIEEVHRLEQFKVHENRLKEDTLKTLYLRYKAIQATNAKLDDPIIVKLAEKAKIEMVKAAHLMEEAIKNLQSQNR